MTERVIDASVLVRPGTPEWPGDTPYACGWTWRIADGASVNLSALAMSPHVGTHADAPLHVRDGADAADALPLAAFAGAAYVLTVAGPPRDVSLAELAPRIPAGVVRLLLRTGRDITGGVFPDDWPALTASAAASMARGGLRLLGVDTPSVDRRESKSLDVHHAIFGGGGCVLENLDLRDAEDGWYELAAYPLKLAGLDAAPVRAVLRELTAYPART